MPQEIRDKISAANKGKKRTTETREKMSRAFRGRKLSAEHVETIRRRNTGKKASDETKAKMSVARLGKKRPEHGLKVKAALVGVPHTEERKKNQKFAQWDRNPTWLEADSIYDKWIETGKPGLIRLQKHFDEFSLGSIHKCFAQGWIPAEDSEWLEYRASRPVRQAD